MMHTWHEQEMQGLQLRLKAMRLFPYFFSPPPSGRKARDIDVSELIKSVRGVSYMVEQRHVDPEVDVYGFKSVHVWNRGDPAQLFFNWVETHKESLSGESDSYPTGADTSQRLMSSWCGITSATALFLNSVAGLANGGEPIESRLHRRVLLILKRDIDTTKAVMCMREGLDRDFWLWKAFIGAMSLSMRRRSEGGERHSSHDKPFWEGEESVLDVIETQYHDYVRAWSTITNISRWKDVKAVLCRVAWPMASPNEPVAKDMLERITQSRGSPTSLKS